MLREGQATDRTHREDYSAPAYWIDTVDLDLRPRPGQDPGAQPHAVAPQPRVSARALRLDGDELNLARVMVDGQGTSFMMDGRPTGDGEPARGRRALRAGDLHHLLPAQKHQS